MGEPAGIGPDVVLAAWQRQQQAFLPPFFTIADPDMLSARATQLGLDIVIEAITSIDDLPHVSAGRLPVIPLDGSISGQPGQPSPDDPPLILQSLDRCIDLCLSGQAAGLVTAPISKAALYANGFEFQGHTDFLAHKLAQQTKRPITELMMLCAPRLQPPLRVVPVTIHIPLADVPGQLTIQAITSAGKQLNQALKDDFGLSDPVIGVAALNPHAGEDGALGSEEADIVTPAIQALADLGMDVHGPFPADTLFHDDRRRDFDAILCMYHDQALIPIKTLDFHGGVNATLGLPIVRTSPDHGTGYDIAGTGQAKPDSFIAALQLAADMANLRRQDALS